MSRCHVFYHNMYPSKHSAGGAPMLFREKGELTGVSRCRWLLTRWQFWGSTRSCSDSHFRILCWFLAILVGRVHVGRKQKRPWVNCLQNMEMWPQSGMSMISFYKYHTIWPADKLTQIPFFPPHFISSPSGLGSPARSPRFIWQMNVTTVGVQIKICGKMCDSFQVMSKY